MNPNFRSPDLLKAALTITIALLWSALAPPARSEDLITLTARELAAECRRAVAIPNPTNGEASRESVSISAAVVICEGAAKMSPGDAELTADLSKALIWEGRQKEAFERLQGVSGSGSAAVQTLLGIMYGYGIGVAQNADQSLAWLHKAAEQGDATAEYYLGLSYERGFGVIKDDYEAARWYRKAAEQGNQSAQFSLGAMYENGAGVAKDATEALRWYRLAAEQGDAFAQARLGDIYKDGIGVSKDAGEAVRWYRLAAEQGDAFAQAQLGDMYRSGVGVGQDAAEAARWYRKAAEQGYAYAQSYLAFMYQHGTGVARDAAEAARWYQKAARQGEISAEVNLGYMYANGLGVVNDDAEALHWYRTAADQGNASAQNKLGTMYEDGIGVPRNNVEAVRWYRKAATKGYADAQNNLGEMYFHGTGVAQDEAKAQYWYRKAAEQGCDSAEINLGAMYEYGDGVQRDEAEAVRWYRKAAEQENSLAQSYLGWMYENGRGVPRDYASAAMFYLDAARGGSEDARTRIDRAYVEIDDRLHTAIVGNGRAASELKSVAIDIGAGYEETTYDCYAVRCGEAAWRLVDLAQAATWYRRAADDDAEAAFRLGRLLIAKPELELQQGEGRSRLQNAATAGNARAVFYVAILDLPADPHDRSTALATTLALFDPQAAAELAFEAATGRFGDSIIGLAFQYLVNSSKRGISVASIALISVYGFYGDFEQAEEVITGLKSVHWFEISGWDYSIDHLLSFWLTTARKGYVPEEGQREGLRRLLTTLVDKQSTTAGQLLSKLDLLEDILKRTNAAEASSTPPQSRMELRAQINRIKGLIRYQEKLGGLSPLVVKLYQRLADFQAELGQNDEAADSTLTALSIGIQINRDTRHLQGSLVYHLNQSCQLQQASESLFALGRPETALLLAKSAVNELQDARTELVGLPQKLQGCFRNLVSDQYRVLADLFIKQGHFVEAEWVLGQLKDYETYEFTREDPGLVNNAFEHIPLTLSQSDALTKIVGLPLVEQYRLSQRLDELRQLDDPTERQRTELSELEHKLNWARIAFENSLVSLRVSVKALEAKRREVDQPPVEDISDSGIMRLQGRLTDLPSATAYFYTVVLPDRVHILLSTKDGTEHIEIVVKEEDLNAIIARARLDLQDRGKDPKFAAEALYDLLWKPVEEALQKLQITDVVLSLDRQLRYIPFPALYDGKSYLIERYRFAVLTSSSQDQLLADNTLGTLSAQALGASRGGQGFAPLKNVVEEVDSIVKSANDNTGLLPGQRWLDDAFSKSGLSEALASNSPIIHVATHFAIGVSDDTSRMLLGTGEILSVSDLLAGIRAGTFKVNRVRLLVLSACETGLGNGEQLESLAATMQAWGVRSVLATLWPVADRSTTVFMIRFYSYLAQGRSRAQAVRAAQLDFIHGASAAMPLTADSNNSQNYTTFAHPRYWAPFTLMGQWR